MRVLTRLHCTPTALSGVWQIRRQAQVDVRGSFTRIFCAVELAEVGWTSPVVQVNHSINIESGTVRGLHCQLAPWAEKKLVSCVRGRIWDIALDLRRQSPTFLRWHAQELSAETGLALLVPEGCAHGYQALSDDAEVVYCHSAPYVAESQAGVHPCDPRLGIEWPLPMQRLSKRDAAWPPLGPDSFGVESWS